MIDVEHFEKQLTSELPSLPNGCTPPSINALRKTIRRRSMRKWAAAMSLCAVVFAIGIRVANRDNENANLVTTNQPASANDSPSFATVPNHGSAFPIANVDDEEDFRVFETWTTAMPVVYEHPESKELRQGWQIQKHRRPVNPRTLGSSERASVYRVLFDRSLPPGPEL